MQNLSWIVALMALSLLAIVLAAAWSLQSRRSRPPPLPAQWGLAARPVFSTDERRVHRLLREALPHHVVLSKLPLVRFCQPTEPNQRRYWFDLLGSVHMTFAICSPNGRVLAAIDLDCDRNNSTRVLQIKRSVLRACGIRYLRCPIDPLPSAADLQRLVPSTAAAARGARPRSNPGDLGAARDALASVLAQRRAERPTWQDSTQFHDSFFAADSRFDGLGSSDFAPLSVAPRSAGGFAYRPSDAIVADTARDIGGVVIEAAEHASTSQR